MSSLSMRDARNSESVSIEPFNSSDDCEDASERQEKSEKSEQKRRKKKREEKKRGRSKVLTEIGDGGSQVDDLIEFT